MAGTLQTEQELDAKDIVRSPRLPSFMPRGGQNELSLLLLLPGTGGSYRIKGFTLCYATTLLGHLPAKDC